MGNATDASGSNRVSLCVRGQLDFRTVQSLWDPLVERRAGTQRDPLVLDLSGVTFVTPFALVALATLLEHRQGGTTVHLVCPRHADCRQYLAVSGFLQQAAAFANVEGAEGFGATGPSWGADTVLPLTRLDEGRALAALRHRVQERLSTMLGGHDGNRRDEIAPILSTIQEACANVFQHAGCPTCWVAAQRYLNHYSGAHYVEIGIADAGCGIRESLATRFGALRRMPDGAAIMRMLAEGLSRFADEYRGNGYQVLQNATRVRDGSFYLRSGNGAVGRQRRSGLLREDFGVRWPGTQLCVRLTCP